MPEVETLKLGLQEYIVGKKITGVNVIDRSLFSGDEKNVIGATIKNIRRYAKGMVIDLDNKYSFAIHIKLTGQLIFRDKKTKDLPVLKPVPLPVPNKFTRVIIALGDRGEGLGDSYLYFQEVRGFAWMKLLKTSEVGELPFFKSLGPEFIPSPGSGAPKLTLEVFEKIISRSSLPIKALIMDQKRIGGIGNIYANDSCFDACIDPRRSAKTLTKDEGECLFDSILNVLKEGLRYKGSSELNYVNVLGQTGEYQKHMLVYGRKGKKCIRNDSGMVEKIYLAGRGTFFCAECQI